MKKVLFCALTAAAACILTAGDTAFHRGGVTFPMEKISAERFAPRAASGENLILDGNFAKDFVPSGKSTEGWVRGFWIFGKEEKKFMKEAGKLTRAQIITEEGQRLLELNRPASLEKLMGAKASSLYISATHTATLPDALGGTYKLSLEYRNQIAGTSGFLQGVLVYYKDAPVKGKNVKSYQLLRLNSSPSWVNFSADLTLPPKTAALDIVLRADGCGRLLIRNVSLVRNAVDAAAPIVAETTPMGMLDNTFALAAGDPGTLGFRFKNTLPKGQFKAKKLLMHIELPADVAIIGTNNFLGPEFTAKEITVGGKKYKSWELPLSYAITAGLRNSNSFTGWHVPSVVLRSSAAPDKGRICRFYLTENGKTVSNTGSFTLKMIPALPEVPRPKRFLPGFSSVSQDVIFARPEVREAFARFVMTKSGTRWITASVTDAEAAAFRKAGVTYLTFEPWAIANGYRLGRIPAAKKPAYSFYRDAQGRSVEIGGPATCPAAIYNRTPYYTEHVLPELKKSVAGRDGITPNWEPYSFRGKGCFCDTCREEFAKYAKFPIDKVKELWPKELQVGGTHREQAIHFRGWQHGRMALTLHEDLLKMGASNVGFCPEVGTDQIVRSPSYFEKQWEFTPYEYAGKTKWLNVWGPYIWFIGDRPYVYSKGAHVRYWEVIRRAVRDYRASLKGSRAKLLAMPHGNQVSTTALGQPEGMAMDQISAYLAGFHASQLYFFPRGYDHRFWAELGRSSRLIALTDEMVMEGKVLDTLEVAPLSPFPAPIRNISPSMMPDVKVSPLIQGVAFARGGKYLAAVGNFWEKADVIFSLRLKGLPAGKTWQVKEIPYDRQFTRAKGKLYTSAELARGIPLHAGALRWVFFELSPAAKPIPGLPELTRSDLEKEKARLDRVNRPAFEAEEARDKALRSENDTGKWNEMSSGKVKCTVIDPGEKNLLRITSGKNSVTVNPRGLAIESWELAGEPQADRNFGMSCFWSPGKHGMQLFSPCRVTEQKFTPAGELVIVGENTTSVRTFPDLPDLRIRRQLTFSPDLTAVTFDVKLTNTTENVMNDVGHRWFFMPSAWNNKNGGSMVLGGKAFTRPHGYTFYKKDIDSVSEEIIRRIFLVKSPTVAVDSSALSFKAPGKKSMEIAFSPADALGGVAVWDTPELFSPTCEPCLKPVQIPPGGSVGFSVRISLR